MDGKPLEGAILEFNPLESGQALNNDRVMTDAQGNFKIEPQKKKANLKPGKFGVRVYKWVDKKTKQPPSNPEDIEQLRLGGFLVNTVPFKYWDPESNPIITVDLKSGSNPNVKIDVSSK